MKRKRTWIIALACVVIAAVGLASWHFVRRAVGEKPFADLEASDLEYATLYLAPPGESLGFNFQGELEELVSYFRELTIYERDDSYVDYCGQTVRYYLGMADGSQHQVTVFQPFLIIDDVGYRTDYASCEALSQYSNEIMNTTCQQIPMEEVEEEPLMEPPAMDLNLWSVSALRGGYSWTIYHDDGTGESTIADSAHPLDCRESLTRLETSESTVWLKFGEPPVEITDVRCWSDADFGDPTAESKPVEADGQTITLLPGGHVYEVTARWEGKDYEGEASYSFWIDAQF